MKRHFSILMAFVIFVTTIYSQGITAYAVNPPVIQDGGYIIESLVGPNKVLDIWEGSKDNGVKVIIWDRHGRPNQTFYFSYDPSDGLYSIMATHSGKYLGVESSKQATQIKQFNPSYESNFKWKIEPLGGGVYQFRIKSKVTQEKKAAQLEKTRKELETKVSQAKQELQRAEKTSKDTASKLEAAKKVNESCDKTAQDLKAKIAKAKEKAVKKEKERQELQVKIQQTNNRASERKTTLENLQEKIGEAKKELERAKEETKKLKVEKEEAEEQNKKKEEEFEKILKEWGER